MPLQPHQFKAFRIFFETLRTELGSLREAIQKCCSAIANQRITQDKSERDDREKISHAIDNLTNQTQESDNAAETNQGRRHGQNLVVQGVLAIATMLAFLAAGIYAWEAHEQLKESQKSTWTAQEQLTETRNDLDTSMSEFDRVMRQNITQTSAQIQSADAAIRELRAAHGADLFLDHYLPINLTPKNPVGKGNLIATVRVKNVGSGEAKQLLCAMRVEVRESPPPSKYEFKQSEYRLMKRNSSGPATASSLVLPAGGSLPDPNTLQYLPNDPYVAVCKYPPDDSNIVNQQTIDPEMHIFVWGTISYIDPSGNRCQSYCQRLKVSELLKTPDHQYGGGGTEDCFAQGSEDYCSSQK